LRLEVVFVDAAGRCMPYFRPIEQAASNHESDKGGNDV
jgi:hypothetical protein